MTILTDLLLKIAERKNNEDVETIAALRENTTYLAPQLKSWPDKLIKQETFMYESYLLQLREIKPIDENEANTIDKTQKELTRLLKKLYAAVGFSEDFINKILKNLKSNHASKADFYLTIGTKKNDAELFDAALIAGADVNYNYPEAAIISAVRNKNINMVKTLLEKGATPNPDNEHVTPLILAVENNQLDLVKLLVEAKADINQIINGKNAIYQACFIPNVSLEILEYLLLRPETNIHQRFIEQKYITLISAVLSNINSDPEVQKKIQCLLKHKAIRENADFHTAIYLGVNAIKLLLDLGYALPEDALKEALSYLNLDGAVIDLLIPLLSCSNFEEAKQHLHDEDRSTDLMFYVAIGDINNVREILKTCKESLNARNRLGQTALMIACQLGREEIANLLVYTGANINYAESVYGYTALMLASEAGHTPIVKLLLEHNADVNYQTTTASGRAGITALYLATEAKNVPIVSLLLSVKDIDVNIYAEGDSTPAELAKRSTDQEIKNAFALKHSKNLIKEVHTQVDPLVQKFKKNAAFTFGIGNQKKANKIEAALKNVEEKYYLFSNISEILNFKPSNAPNHESILEAFKYHRIGFFGPPKSYLQMEKYLKEQALDPQATELKENITFPVASK